MSHVEAGQNLLRAEEHNAPVASSNHQQHGNHRWRRWARFVVIVAAVIAAVGIWDEFFKYRFIAKRFGAVVPGKIYRSGQISKWMLDETVRDHDLEVIVDLNGIEEWCPHQDYEISAVERLGVELYRFPLAGDGTGDLRYYADAVEVLAECERQGRAVLVHCAAGAQRTGGVVAAYRILVQGRPAKEACDEMQKYGWRPNRDLELLPYLDENLAQLAVMLHQRGVIDELPSSVPSLDRIPAVLAN